MSLRVRAVDVTDRGWVQGLMLERWAAETVVVHGTVYRPFELAGLVAVQGESRVGLLTYDVQGRECEIVTLDSLVEGAGVGTALIEAAREVATAAGCTRLWLVTTNDNVDALRFYQKRGFVLAALHRDAVADARRLKPQIPLIGNDGIPLRDEIELAMSLA